MCDLGVQPALAESRRVLEIGGLDRWDEGRWGNPNIRALIWGILHPTWSDLPSSHLLRPPKKAVFGGSRNFMPRGRRLPGSVW